jgi:hypothetical protein
MRSWSQAFVEYLDTSRDKPITQQECSFDLRVPISVVHGWRRGGRPRSDEIRARVEVWSGGRVPRDLPKDPVPSSVARAEESGPALPSDAAPATKAG